EIVCGVAGLSTGCCGIGGAGRDRVHPDVHTTQFVCQLLRQPVHSRLGQTVKTGIEPRCGRTLVHDRTATTLLHVRVHRTSDDKRTVHIHVHEPAVVLPIHGNQQVELHVTVDRRIVHTQVDATELIRCDSGHGFHGGGIGNVRGDMTCLPTRGPDRVRHFLTGFVVNVRHHDRSPFSGKPSSVCFADAGSSAGDHCDLALVPSGHFPSLVIVGSCAAHRERSSEPSSNPLGEDLGFEVLFEPRQSHLSTDSGLLVTSERDIPAVPNPTVECQCAGATPLCDGFRPLVGAAVHRTRQTVRGIVGDANRIVVPVVSNDDEYRTEDFLACSPCCVVQPGDHRRL